MMSVDRKSDRICPTPNPTPTSERFRAEPTWELLYDDYILLTHPPWPIGSWLSWFILSCRDQSSSLLHSTDITGVNKQQWNEMSIHIHEVVCARSSSSPPVISGFVGMGISVSLIEWQTRRTLFSSPMSSSSQSFIFNPHHTVTYIHPPYIHTSTPHQKQPKGM